MPCNTSSSQPSTSICIVTDASTLILRCTCVIAYHMLRTSVADDSRLAYAVTGRCGWLCNKLSGHRSCPWTRQCCGPVFQNLGVNPLPIHKPGYMTLPRRANTQTRTLPLSMHSIGNSHNACACPRPSCTALCRLTFSRLISCTPCCSIRWLMVVTGQTES